MKLPRAVPLILTMGLGLGLGLGLFTPAEAVYIGASWVQTDSEFEVATDDFEPDDQGWKLYGGTTWFKFLGVEASYRDLGNHFETSLVNEVNVDIKSYDIGARGILPIAPFFSVFARVGYGLVATDGTTREINTTTDVGDDEWSVMYGAGIEFKIARIFGLRAEWEEYDVDTLPSSLTSASAGFFLRF